MSIAPDPVEVSLIVCTLGRSHALGRLLTSLRAQELRGFEIIIVDQNPPGFLDPTLDQFSPQLPLRRIRSEPGLSRARNVGLREAAGALVGFPDDDCWYAPTVLTQVAARFRAQPGLGLLLGRTIDRQGRESVGSFRRDSGTVSKWNVWASGNSSTLFVRRRLAHDIGGFDEDLGLGAPTAFQSGEESDFILRGLSRGAIAFYDRALTIQHDPVDPATGRQLQRARGYSAGFGRVLRKHRYGSAYLLYRLARSASRSLFDLAGGDPGKARYKLAWAVGTLHGYLARPAQERQRRGRG